MVSVTIAVSCAIGIPLLVFSVGLLLCLWMRPKDNGDKIFDDKEYSDKFGSTDVEDIQWDDMNTWVDMQATYAQTQGPVKIETKVAKSQGVHYVPIYRKRITEICNTVQYQNYNKEKQSFSSSTTTDGLTLGEKQAGRYYNILPVFNEYQPQSKCSGNSGYTTNEQSLVKSLLHQDFGPYTSLV